MEIAISDENRGRQLLDVTREKLRVRHMVYRTEQVYLQWIRRYILCHHRQHPLNLGETGVVALFPIWRWFAR